MSTDQTSDIPRRELWRPDETEIGFDLGIAAEDIFLAAGIMVYCDEDPFRTDCMHAVMRRLKAMTAKRPDVPTTEERLEAVERLEQVAQELRTVIGTRSRSIMRKLMSW